MKPGVVLVVAAVLVFAATEAQNNWAAQNEAIKRLTKALITQDLYISERIRSDGDSGIKQVRMKGFSTRPYLSNTFTSRGPASIHNHDNNIRTIGMGEIDAVLNGVEFRTRHNDYRLRMPSTTSADYHAVEDIPFPPVPESVLQQTTVEGQIAEMKKYFEAFAKQRRGIRDYGPYFRPVLCYLEGAWTNHTDSIEESFDSDRHFLDAESWEHLEDKVRFNSYAGAKDNAENIAFLPSKLWDVGADGMTPYFAQWNYRILCQPLRIAELRTNRLRVVDDLPTRMKNGGVSMEEFADMRGARFQVNYKNRPWHKNDREYSTNTGGFIDSLMAQVPGKNNHGAVLRDNAYGHRTTNLRGNPLNTAFYHQLYKTSETGAMGQTTRTRGFSDKAIYMAMTTQQQVRGRLLKDCDGAACEEWWQRWTYAIPLEIIYLTPLSNWNPYDIRYWGEGRDAKKIVSSNGRDGVSAVTAFNGTDGKRYFRTPAEFFSGDTGESDDADTGLGEVWVLDTAGNPHKTRSSGHHIIMPEIAGVGKIRQRYPIFPVHQEGSLSMKELEALKDIIFKKEQYPHMYYDFDGSTTGGGTTDEWDEMDMLTPPSAGNFGNHVHTVHLTADDVSKLSAGQEINVNTEQAHGHTHWLKLQAAEVMGELLVTIVECDLASDACWDGHTGELTPE